LVGALEQADLVGVLSGDGPFTVFAPTNDAFEAISSITASLSTEQLAKVLKYHVLQFPYPLKKTDLEYFANSDLNPLLSNHSFYADTEETTLHITGEKSRVSVTVSDVICNNGVVHIVDAVLLPINLASTWIQHTHTSCGVGSGLPSWALDDERWGRPVRGLEACKGVANKLCVTQCQQACEAELGCKGVVVRGDKSCSLLPGFQLPACDSSGRFDSSDTWEAPSSTVPYATIAIGTYPNSTGPLSKYSTFGSVDLIPMDGNSVKFTWNLRNLDAACNTPPADVANACGIHIHEGRTCIDASAVGGHYHAGDADPWAPVRYNTTVSGSTIGSTIVDIGETDIAGRAFVVHDSMGERVGCGLIPAEQWMHIMSGRAYFV